MLHFADVCYIGQGYHLEVPLHLDAADGLDLLYEDFLATHERVHGHAVAAPARFVNIRTVHRRHTPRVEEELAAGLGDETRRADHTGPDLDATGKAPGENRTSESSPDATALGRIAAAWRTVEPVPDRPDDNGFRMVRFPNETKRLPTRIFARSELATGKGVAGPAIIEQDDTTTLIPPGWTAMIDNDETMILSPGASGSAAPGPSTVHMKARE